MAALHYARATPIAVTATTAAIGYLATNINEQSVIKEWRATGTGATDIIITFATAIPIYSLMLQAANFASATVYRSADGSSYTSVGTITNYIDRISRRRGIIVINNATVKAIKISIASGTPADGAAFWRLGAAYVMQSKFAVPVGIQYGYSVDPAWPIVQNRLLNGKTVRASTGARYLKIKFAIDRLNNEDIEPLLRLTDGTTAVLDLELSTRPEQVWPVMLISETAGEQFDNYASAKIQLEFDEVV